MISCSERKKRGPLLAILYIVILCLVVSASLSWFIFNRTVTIENQGDMQITAGSRLEISVDGGTEWGDYFPITIEDANYPDITGDGKTFYCPMFLDASDKVFQDVSTFREVTKENENLYLITVRVKFKTAAKTAVYLSSESFVNGKEMSVISDENKSLYGNISRDGIAGAVRVAFVEEIREGEEVVKNVWIPNDTFQLGYDQSGKATFKQDGRREDVYGYLSIDGASVLSHSYSPEDFCRRNVTVGSGSSVLATLSDDESSAMINEAQALLTFDGKSGLQEKTLIIRIWVEGTDREADKALVGGRMEYKFHFVSIDKDLCPFDPSYIILNTGTKMLTLTENAPELGTSLDGLVEYSMDGLTWNKYSGTLSWKDTDRYIYVRYIETVGYQASEAHRIQLPTGAS